QHNIHLCNPSTLWNGESTHVMRDQNGRLINPLGAELCLKWQLLVNAPIHPIRSVISAPAAERRVTELRIVLEHRKTNALTPLNAEAW
ncbi:hypothetical protein C8F01DRAFT_931693, partial [Mycena amicta]